MPSARRPSAAARIAAATLASLYKGRADYQSQVAKAAQDLVDEGYLLRLDADNLFIANAQKISPALIRHP
ncbi:MAG: alpha/beta hydrolase domain-containing protein [Pararobbsia sp.]